MTLLEDAIALSVDEKTTYVQRIERARALGRQHADNPELDAVIAALRDVGEPDLIEVEDDGEDGFASILPNQKRDSAHNYSRLQIAINIASAAKKVDVLRDELFEQPSIMFNRLCARDYVAFGGLSDEDLGELIFTAVPSVRRHLIRESLKNARSSMFDSIAQRYVDEFGNEVFAGILHGCSDDVVLTYLKNPEFVDLKQIQWKKMADFHVPAVLDLLEYELQQQTWKYRDTTWYTWSQRLDRCGRGLRELLIKPGVAEKLLALLTTYGCATWGGPGNGPNNLDEVPLKYMDQTFPTFFSTYRHVIAKAAPKTYVKFVKHFMVANPHTGMLASPDRTNRGYGSTIVLTDKKLSFSRIRLPLLRAHIRRSGTASTSYYALFGGGSALGFVISNPKKMFDSVSPAEAAIVLDLLLQYVESNPPTERWRQIVTRVLSTQIASLSSLVTSHDLIFVRLYQQYILSMADRINRAELVIQRARSDGEGFDAALSTIERCRALGFSAVDSLCARREADKRVGIDPNLAKAVATLGPDAFEQFVDRIVSHGLTVASDPATRDSAINPITVSQYNYGYLLNSGQVLYHAYGADLGRASEVNDKLIDALFAPIGDEPVIQFDLLMKLAKKANPAKALTIFQLYSQADIENIAQNDLTQLRKIMGLGRAAGWAAANSAVRDGFDADYNAKLAVLLAEETGLPPDVTDALQEYKDVGDHDVRKEMQKATGSNSPIERAAALSSLFRASGRHHDPVTHARRTLTFLAKKIRNESLENRAKALDAAVFDFNATGNFYDQFYDADGNRRPRRVFNWGFLAEECRELWLTMLQDACESRDLDDIEDGMSAWFRSTSSGGDAVHDDHAVFRSFMRVSRGALFLGAMNVDAALVDFGVEIQWKIQVFREGLKKSSRQVSLNVGPLVSKRHNAGVTSEKFLRIEDEAPFVSALLKSLHDRVGDEYVRRPAVLLNSFAKVVGKRWPEYAEFREMLTNATNYARREEAERDFAGLLVLRSDDKFYAATTALADLLGRKWSQVDELREAMDTLLHSRLARCVLFKYWWPSVIEWKSGRGAYWKSKDEAVKTLLSVCKSAIHLRPVWSHLANRRQDLLTPYLNSRRIYPGVFYGFRDAAKATLDWGRLALRTSFRASRSKNLQKPKAQRQAPRTYTAARHVDVDSELREESRLRERDAEGEPDLPEHFRLPVVFGLHKLLPSQAAALADVYADGILSDERTVPEKTKSAVNWTLNPTVTYKDIVEFINTHEAGDPTVSKPPLFVNIIEALLRGVMKSDEPCAPLPYLLSPKFLSSDRARAAIYAVGACVPHISLDVFTEMMRTILTGKRRTLLKVTAYKEVIRLLASRPTDRHMEMIAHEWARDVVHRDVRITILRCCIAFLADPHGTELAWNTLEDAVANKWQEAEIVAALVAARPGDRSGLSAVEIVDSCLLPRLPEVVEEMSRCRVPERHIPRYISNILQPICRLPRDQSTAHEELHYIAVAAMSYFADDADCVATVTEDLIEALVVIDPEKVMTVSPRVAKAYNARFSMLYRMMNSMNCRIIGTQAQTEAVGVIASRLVDILNGTEVMEVKRVYMHWIELFLSMVTYEHRKEIQPIRDQGALFWKALANYTVRWDNYLSYTEETVRASVQHMFELLVHASTHAYDAQFVLDCFSSLFRRFAGSNYYHREYNYILNKFIGDLIKGPAADADPALHHLYRMAAVEALRQFAAYTDINDRAILDFGFDVLSCYAVSPMCHSVEYVSGCVGNMFFAACSAVDNGSDVIINGLLEKAHELVTDGTIVSKHYEARQFARCVFSITKELVETQAISYWRLLTAPLLFPFLHDVVLVACENPSDREFSRAGSLITTVISSIQNNAVGGWATRNVLSSATLHAVEAVVTNNLGRAAAITKTYNSDTQHEDLFAPPAGAQAAANIREASDNLLYNHIMYRIGLHVLTVHNAYVMQRWESAAAFMIAALERAEMIVEEASGVLDAVVSICSSSFRFHADPVAKLLDAVQETFLSELAAARANPADASSSITRRYDTYKDETGHLFLPQTAETVLGFIRDLLPSPLVASPTRVRAALSLLTEFGPVFVKPATPGVPETVREWRDDFKELLLELADVDDAYLQREIMTTSTIVHDFPKCVSNAIWHPTPAQTDRPSFSSTRPDPYTRAVSASFVFTFTAGDRRW